MWRRAPSTLDPAAWLNTTFDTSRFPLHRDFSRLLSAAGSNAFWLGRIRQHPCGGSQWIQESHNAIFDKEQQGGAVLEAAPGLGGGRWTPIWSRVHGHPLSPSLFPLMFEFSGYFGLQLPSTPSSKISWMKRSASLVA
jgi:hypothetical protein